MKIALVHDFLIRHGGAERVLESLSNLFPEAPIYTILYDEARMGQRFPAKKIYTSFLQKIYRLFPWTYGFLRPWMPYAIESFDFTGYDLVISSNSAYAHGLITNLETSHLCYYHSPTRWLWDYRHPFLKEQKFNPLTLFLAKWHQHRLRTWDFLAADRVDYIMANSETVRRRIQKFYRRDAEVVFPPVDISRFQVKKEHQNYCLIVSTLTPYKKIDLAIEVFNKLGKHLIIIGEGKDADRLKKLAGPTIDFLGFKSDELVQEYMQNCRAFIFPGEEDFGIAPVEAMACGKPVLAYQKGGVTETLIPGKTGEFFKELTPESFEEGLTQLFIHEKNYDAQTIRAHAEQFSKEVFEKKMLDWVSSFKNS